MSHTALPRTRSRLRSGALILGCLLIASPNASAQQGDSGLIVPRPEWPMLSGKAREQIAAVERTVADLQTPAAARAAGFQPVLGMIPTMGEHWVNTLRMGNAVDPLQPEQLMFSPIGGEMRLVGVAYAFFGKTVDQAPDLFESEQDVWHAHPELKFASAPGQTLIMLHLWFVPSPDGPFAGHNPWLPYWAAGMHPPEASLLSEPTSASRVRRLGLALAEAVEPMPLAQALMRSDANAPQDESGLPPKVVPLRDSLRAAIPRLNAVRAGDQAAWNREADATIVVWEQIRDAYLEAIPIGARAMVAGLYQKMAAGAHGH